MQQLQGGGWAFDRILSTAWPASSSSGKKNSHPLDKPRAEAGKHLAGLLLKFLADGREDDWNSAVRSMQWATKGLLQWNPKEPTQAMDWKLASLAHDRSELLGVRETWLPRALLRHLLMSRLQDVQQAEANMVSMTELSLAPWEPGHREAKTPQGNT